MSEEEVRSLVLRHLALHHPALAAELAAPPWSHPGPTLEQVAAAWEGRRLAAALVLRHLSAQGSSFAAEFRSLYRPKEGLGPGLAEVVSAWQETVVCCSSTSEESSEEEVQVVMSSLRPKGSSNFSPVEAMKNSSKLPIEVDMTKEGSSDDDVMVEEVVRDAGGDQRSPTEGRNKDKVTRNNPKNHINKLKTSNEPEPVGAKRQRQKRLTPEEFKVIQAAMAEFGDSLESSVLARQLGRHQVTIEYWLTQIKRKGGLPNGRTQKSFTLDEDFVIIDSLVAKLEGRKLVNMLEHDWPELDQQLGRAPKTTRVRWLGHLLPWLLQHAAGTLNRGVELMLVSHISENYQTRSNINWIEVVSKFAGHTVASLKGMFYNFEKTLVRDTGRPLNEITFQCVLASVTNEHTSQVAEAKRERQRRVIDYFEQRVAKLGMTNYI
jgi:hypothetical protein